MFFLHGPVGSGKSTVANTVANFYRSIHRLGAYLFFSSETPQASSPSHVIRTLAFQLGLFDPNIGRAIANYVGREPSIASSPFRTQFESLLVNPLGSIEDVVSAAGPIVIVIDSLDECGTVSSRKDLLAVLANQSSRLPSWLRIVITSRKGKDITDALEGLDNVRSRPVDITSASNIADITAYWEEEMKAIRTSRSRRHLALEPNWPGSLAIQRLAQRKH